MESSKVHFDKVSCDYDYWKKRNYHYYDELKKALREIIPVGAGSVLDIGCGTGDLLAFLDPKMGVGIDVSTGMVDIARKKYPKFKFQVSPIEMFKTDMTFDFVLFIDVIEHVQDLESTFKHLAALVGSQTQLVLMMANPSWEPVLLPLEWMGKKMPEGPHYRPSEREVKRLLQKNGLRIEVHSYRQLIPMNIGALSRIINSMFYKVPILRRLGLTEIMICRKQDGMLRQQNLV